MILVTGASKGLGRAICERLVSKKIDLLGLARNINDLPFQAVACDVAKYDDLKKIATDLKLKKQAITGIINAAGIASMNLAITTPEHVTRKVIETNLLGTIFCCQLFSPLLIRNKKGRIINFSTIANAIGLKGESIYIASKAGVEGFTRSFAREMADFNITVNCIAPGPINTNLLKGITQIQINHIVSHQIIPKQFSPDTVCDLVEILLDDRSESLSGQIFNVGGV